MSLSTVNANNERTLLMNRRQLLLGSLATTLLAGDRAFAQDILRARDFYRKDGSYTDIAKALEGGRVAVEGFMAPPLKAESDFFVLTNRPMAVCPFCETEADWPEDILAVYTKRIVEVVSFNSRIVTKGILELGSFKDPETGFVSLVRLTNAVYERV
ncbi:hypothetical protein [Roseibium sp. M-1]